MTLMTHLYFESPFAVVQEHHAQTELGVRGQPGRQAPQSPARPRGVPHLSRFLFLVLIVNNT